MFKKDKKSINSINKRVRVFRYDVALWSDSTSFLTKSDQDPLINLFYKDINMEYHYVYRITNLQTKMYYYGDRTSIVQPKKDLGVFYFSSFSNKFFKIDQMLNPTHYRYKIIKEISTRKQAKAYERMLHLKFDVKLHQKFINRANQPSEKLDRLGIKHTETSKKKISAANLGSIPWNKNKSNKDDSRILSGSSHPLFSIGHTAESKKKISDTWKQKHDDNPELGKEITKHLQSKEAINYRTQKQHEAGLWVGDKNPMFGKKHSNSTIIKNKISQARYEYTVWFNGEIVAQEILINDWCTANGFGKFYMRNLAISGKLNTTGKYKGYSCSRRSL